MKITPISGKVVNFNLKALPPQSQKKKQKKTEDEVNATINFDNEVYINTHDSKIFKVRYKLLVTIPHQVEVNLTYDFDFRSDEEVDSDIPKSLTIRSDVPAYCYPYMKSYVENILNMSGYGGVPLPYLDFIGSPIGSDKIDTNKE
ncbi:hypothetical protein NFJ87_10560 [Citrobacter freundii]|uniref:hypothetical protein n=1 Tax=Citrobacter freundii TaxID=546 RepID=UPI0024308BDE|nr:hypothetical protein [Citrobacter freundii]WFW93797.1 hypothetical protein NFJ87_10560 [Citrobacter freundii]